ncbi:MAG: cytochrome c maturation protein CcmE [Rhodobacteraceae bacterium]|nr:cytochrome c maturation protein CcmE [Paracoccaceae bacterium]
MYTARKRRRIQLLLASAALLAASTVLVGYALRDGVSYFRSPTEILSELPPATETFRVGGLVAERSVHRQEGGGIEFQVTDGASSVVVRYMGILPDLFSEGQGVVALGTFDGSKFLASEILAKHDENYMPREVVEALKEQGVYRQQE